MNTSSCQKTAPGPRGHFLLGNLFAFRRDPLHFFMDISRQFGDVARFQIGRRIIHLVNRPDHIKYILQDNNKNYSRAGIILILQPLVGQGLVTSQGEVWRRQRRLAQPAFHRQRIVKLATAMTDSISAVIERWQTVAKENQSLDIASEMKTLTFDIACKTLLGIDANHQAEIVSRATRLGGEHLTYHVRRLLRFPLSFPTPGNLRFQHARRELDQVVYDIIDEHRCGKKDRDDLLSMLLQARDEETGEGMSDQQLRDEVLTFMISGHETTANALAWTWYMLSKHPYAERQLRTELATVLNGRTPSFEDLPQLTYTKMVIEESMRLYPPVWAIMRNPVQNDEINGYHIPARSTVMFCPYVTHRHPDFWDNPEGFDPERFAPEQSSGRPRYAYFPFGGGPHQCIGNDFAMMEMQLIIAMLGQAFHLHLVPGYPVEPEPLITLRPRHGIVMTLQQTHEYAN